MADKTNDTYRQLCDQARESKLLETIEALLDWDERTQLPPSGGSYRADQIAYMAGLVHRKRTAPQIGEWLDELGSSELGSRSLQRQRRRHSPVETRLRQENPAAASVGGRTRPSECAGAANVGRSATRQQLRHFQPLLEKILDLKRQEAAALGFDDTPYDRCWTTMSRARSTANVARVLGGLRDASGAVSASHFRELSTDRTFRSLSASIRLMRRSHLDARCRGDWVRFRSGPTRRLGPPVLHGTRPGRRTADDAIQPQ